MSGDYTRFTFDPPDNYSGVRMQQGRVMLDADFNELVDIVDRRWRAETVDIIGRCIVPSETPDGFRIELPGGIMTIGPGRAYVDGLLAENHGAPPLEFHRTLEETRGTQPVPYEKQPHLPDPEPLPTEGGPYLVYLDVWKREVTFTEDPDLVEKAVAVDTAARTQTVWQVKLFGGERLDGISCETPDEKIPGWAEHTAPSAGRLTTAAVGVPTPDDPCIVPPAGGYRGTENRLYRVEIHDPGVEGQATFKWSRDNASWATTITALNAARTELTVVRVGRDAVRRFRTDDWVEVTDDHHELHGLPGVMRKVQKTDDVARTITLTAALPAGEFDPSDPARHTRVKRWDQRGLVRDPANNVVADVDASGGVIPVPAAPTDIVLEDGVQITFSTDPAGGAFRVADYWAFAARTADASVERLTEAPPRGIHHHYCRLAVVTFPREVDDCRVFWPPDFGGGEGGCDCSACVTPESHNSGQLTIQRAVDQVKESGGSVCLGPGFYRLEEPVRITGARSLRLHGQGWRTVLMRFGAGPVIAVDRSIGVTLEDMAIVSPEQGPRGDTAEEVSFGGQVGMGVALLNNGGVTIQRCAIVQVGRRGREPRARAAAGGFGGLAGFALGRGPAIAMAGFQVQTRIRENVLAGGVGVLGVTGGFQTGATEALTVAPSRRFLMTADLFVDDNVMLCGLAGVSLQGASLHVAETRLARNLVAGCKEGGLLVTGAVSREAFPGSHLDVAANTLNTTGDAIVVGTDDARIDGNDVGGSGREEGGDGIVLTRGLDRVGQRRCQVTGNRITGVAGDGIAIRGRVASGFIKQNTIERTRGGGIVMDARSEAGDLVIENNQLLAIAADEDEEGAALAAIRVRNADRVEVASNSIAGVGTDSRKGGSRVGIEVLGARSVRIAGNDVEGVGPAEPFVGDAAGIDVTAPFERLDVVDNAVRRSAERGKPDNARWWGILVRPAQARVTVDTIFLASPAFVLALAEDRVARLPRGREIVGVRGNQADAYGLSPAVEVAAGGACVVSDNRCLLDSERGVPVVALTGGAAIAGGNYLEGAGDDTVMEIAVGAGPFTVVGNIGSGPIAVNGSTLGPPWQDLNVVAP